MPSKTIDNFLESPFSLTSRPEPVPGDLRIMWGVSVVVLILFHSRSKQASFQKLHYFTYSVRTHESRKRTVELFETNASSTEHTIRFEPWLNRAMGFAKGSNLLVFENGKRAKLTGQGVIFANEVLKDSGSLVSEIKFIQSVSKKVSEKFVADMLRRERLL